MALPLNEALAKLQAIPEYQGIDEFRLRRALASYVRTILAGNSPYDRYLNGAADALTPQQKQGLALFRGKAGCISCHLGPNLTDEEKHQTNAGRIDRDKAFKTPSLRHIAKAAPYFHDGHAKTLDEAIALMAKGGVASPPKDPLLKPVKWNPKQLTQVKAFLESLSGELTFPDAPKLP
jgi:cytochrome c peroxidase